MLEVKDLNVFRGKLQVLWNISIKVRNAETVALIGPNGAGKTTLLSTIAGLLKPLSGKVIFEGSEISGLPPHKIVNLGISLVPEDRKLFVNCSVRENLLLGAYTRRARASMKDNLQMVYEIFPILKERENQLAGTLSGGEQRMLAVARSIMSNPKLLMLDEPSQGLAPKKVEELFETLAHLKKCGISILLVEQNAYHALQLADRAYVIETGKINLEGIGKELLRNDYIKTAFLGI